MFANATALKIDRDREPDDDPAHRHRHDRLLEVVDRVQLARAVAADRGVGVERALQVREPAA